MTIEDELKDAMSTQVGEVRANAGTAAAVRGLHRRRTVRLRATGAAVVTAALAGTVPLYLAVSPGQEPGPGQRAASGASVRPGVVMPDVAGMTVEQALRTLQRAGLTVKFRTAPSSAVPGGSVISQAPVAGTALKPGARVTVTVSDGTKDKLPPEVGDLGQGRDRLEVPAGWDEVGELVRRGHFRRQQPEHYLEHRGRCRWGLRNRGGGLPGTLGRGDRRADGGLPQAGRRADQDQGRSASVPARCERGQRRAGHA
ncbi:hypothetical protein C1I98_14775 [Spongiactinospora gelatinilytica]|uniref:PASTA domain-containing protein n=1 Tax=Spongiactinospora gelatinilytica TaxID=2666298 RepID=A0A2W2I6P2_9ACTN|nr:hypothetical protein C1I98_14775 [Spongiactinospora gelatinilytica]